MAVGPAGVHPEKTTARTALGSQGIIRPPVSAADNDGTSAPPKEADRERTDKRPEHNRNWIPWIIGVCIAGGSLAYIFAGFARGNMRLRASLKSGAAQAPRPKSRINLPN